MAWYVCDDDDGVLRKEDTKGEALSWFHGWKGVAPCDASVTRCHAGCYVISAGEGGQASRRWVLFSDGYHAAVRRAGQVLRWDVGQVPLYPIDHQPYEMIER